MMQESVAADMSVQTFPPFRKRLLPIVGLGSLLATGYLSMFMYAAWSSGSVTGMPADPQRIHIVWIVSAIASSIAFEDFGNTLGNGVHQTATRSFLLRLMLLIAAIGAIAFGAGWYETGASEWWLLWLAMAAPCSLASRFAIDSGSRSRPPAEVSETRSLLPQECIGLSPLERMLMMDASCADGIAATQDAKIQAGSPLAPPPAIKGHIASWLPVVLLVDRPLNRSTAHLKSIEDLAMAGLLIWILLPAMACIALAIKLDSPGPVLFRQRRHGLNNQDFDIYKFRTMYDEPVSVTGDIRQTLRGDSRVTRTGRILRKFSLDELPQLFNVLRGQMSIVGPRPHAVNMRTLEQLCHNIVDTYPHRHRVKPGITGWAQVNGFRGATDTIEHLRQRVEMDLYYIDNWSLRLDLRILARTIKVVLGGKNAY